MACCKSIFQEIIDQLKSEVDTVLYRVLEVENMTEAVRADLSPEIATLEDGVEKCVFLPFGLGVGALAESQNNSTTYHRYQPKKTSSTVLAHSMYAMFGKHWARALVHNCAPRSPSVYCIDVDAVHTR